MTFKIRVGGPMDPPSLGYVKIEGEVEAAGKVIPVVGKGTVKALSPDEPVIVNGKWNPKIIGWLDPFKHPNGAKDGDVVHILRIPDE